MKTFTILVLVMGWWVALAKPQVEVKPLFAEAMLAAPVGQTVYLAVVVEVLENWVIPAATVTIKGLTPARLSLEPVPGLKFGEVIYPEPQKKWLDFMRAALEVYTGQVVFIVPVYVEKDASFGVRLIRVSLEYQACEPKLCLLPDSVELTIPVLVIQKPPRR